MGYFCVHESWQHEPYHKILLQELYLLAGYTFENILLIIIAIFSFILQNKVKQWNITYSIALDANWDAIFSRLTFKDYFVDFVFP